MMLAPFTPDQQAVLADHQINPNIHAYTCPWDGSKLIPRETWVCDECTYTQTWAHEYTIRPPMTIEEAVTSLRALVNCRCDPCWTDRRRHEPNSACDYTEEVEVVAAALRIPKLP